MNSAPHRSLSFQSRCLFAHDNSLLDSEKKTASRAEVGLLLSFVDDVTLTCRAERGIVFRDRYSVEDASAIVSSPRKNVA